MPNARIQFSTASKEEWEKVNPKLREGEMAVIKKKTSRYMLKIGDIGGSTYKDSVLVWDQDDAETKMQTATAMAESAKDSADKAKEEASASKQASDDSKKSAESSEESAKQAKIAMQRVLDNDVNVENLKKVFAEKGTTLSDYGINDARIDDMGAIRLGDRTIYPVAMEPMSGEVFIPMSIAFIGHSGEEIVKNGISYPELSENISAIVSDGEGNLSLETREEAAVKVKNSLNVGKDITAEGTITGSKVFNAVYNDYAEWFERGDDAREGHIIALDEEADKEQYIKATDKSRVVVGICTNSYAHIIGGEEHKDYEKHNLKIFIPVSLAGRVPVYVKGKVEIGDYIAPSDIPGVGRAVKNPGFNTVGMALKGNEDEGIKLIKVLVRR